MLERIEKKMTVRSENDLREKYNEWRIIDIETRGSSSSHGYRRYLDEQKEKRMVRIYHESANGRHWESFHVPAEKCDLGLLRDLSTNPLYYCDQWITEITLLNPEETIQLEVEVTNGRYFK